MNAAVQMGAVGTNGGPKESRRPFGDNKGARAEVFHEVVHGVNDEGNGWTQIVIVRRPVMAKSINPG